MTANLCEQCTAACCHYVALPIDEPKTASDFDDIRWYLIHDRIAVFVEDGEWFISFFTACRHLQDDYRCGIYETRPTICRKYSFDNCDYHSGDYGWEEHFTAPEHLDAYLRRRRRRLPTAAPASQRKRQPQVDRAGTPLPPLPRS